MEKIEICNNALIEAHQDTTITNIDEESVDAERCRRIYDSTRRELLSMYPWTFAHKLVKLARVSEDVEGYKYAYKYPSEALRINAFYVSETAFKARRYILFDKADAKVAMVDGDKCILCNYDAPFVLENIDLTEESIFPESFCRLLYLYMALKISKMAGTEASIRQEITNDIATQISFVASATNNEDCYGKDNTNPYVDVRA